MLTDLPRLIHITAPISYYLFDKLQLQQFFDKIYGQIELSIHYFTAILHFIHLCVTVSPNICQHMIIGSFGSTQQQQQQQQQQHSLLSQASWGRLEMKPKRNKGHVQAR